MYVYEFKVFMYVCILPGILPTKVMITLLMIHVSLMRVLKRIHKAESQNFLDPVLAKP